MGSIRLPTARLTKAKLVPSGTHTYNGPSNGISPSQWLCNDGEGEDPFSDKHAILDTYGGCQGELESVAEYGNPFSDRNAIPSTNTANQRVSDSDAHFDIGVIGKHQRPARQPTLLVRVTKYITKRRGRPQDAGSERKKFSASPHKIGLNGHCGQPDDPGRKDSRINSIQRSLRGITQAINGGGTKKGS